MFVTLHTEGLKTLAQLQDFDSNNEAIAFTLTDRVAAYDWMPIHPSSFILAAVNAPTKALCVSTWAGYG